MRQYTTIQGDMWDSISYKMYGTESNMSILIQANTEHMETTIFTAGITLNVPEVETENTNLPPWKRV
ncbi:tail protein X [Chengkuizengella axinellae]|uniref:Tail protein X n=1 Tax=Chengkuizengella axinellae TaxID=3064388 RepID=A0ABT9J822_9BACL|nr:tail protein X [Chengkuizengella sp. 2205SS18-9]MDP5277140.1 tail protein X [Chengkuizengella sp. 2205SS18-9]